MYQISQICSSSATAGAVTGYEAADIVTIGQRL